MIRNGIAFIIITALCSACMFSGAPQTFLNDTQSITVRGEPSARWPNEDGSTVLEFGTQPFGTTCLMVHIAADGTLLAHWDALSLQNRARVELGMDHSSVRRLLGPHRTIQTFRFSGEEVWDWNVRNDGPGYATRFNVHFIDGNVIRTSQTYEFGRRGD